MTLNTTNLGASTPLPEGGKSLRIPFVKTDEWELAGLLGIYGGQIRSQINATTSDAEGMRVSLLDKTTSTNVPLPLIGATLDWYISPRFKLSGSLAAMDATIGGINGSALVATLAAEYMFTRNFGCGLAYMLTDLNARATKNAFNGELGWSMNSLRAYAQVKF